MWKYSALILLIINFFTCADEITIGAHRDTLQKFKFITNSKTCSDIQNFNIKNINRPTVELIILCQALTADDLGRSIKVVEMPNYTRSLMQSHIGDIDIPSETIWLTDINQSNFYISDAIISNGEYEVGIFIKPDRVDMFRIQSAQELGKYIAVSSINWTVDWDVLTQFNIKKHSVSNVLSMFKMVENGRVDFTLQDFGVNENFQIKMEEIALMPVPNIKITLKGSRHFVVSKNRKRSKEIYQALTNGLKKLRNKGSIKKAYIESGFFNSIRDDWKILNLK